MPRPSTCTSTATSCREAVTLYYDPILDVHHEVPVMFGDGPGAVPRAAGARRRAAAVRGGHAAVRAAGNRADRSPPLGPRVSATALWMAKEFGLAPLARALVGDGDEHYEPTWDRDRGEFTWGFALGEPIPRGQYNGTMAAAQVATEKAWSRLATVGPGLAVHGADRRSTSTSRRSRSARRGGTRSASTLFVTPSPMNESGSAEPTTFRVINLPDPSRWKVELEDRRRRRIGGSRRLHSKCTRPRRRAATSSAAPDRDRAR